MFDLDMSSVNIHLNPEVLGNNESAAFRCKPVVIQIPKVKSGAHHHLHPVLGLKYFLKASEHLNVNKLFINPMTGMAVSRVTISPLVRRLVKISQPSIYCPPSHYLRKFSASVAFFSLLRHVGKIRDGFLGDDSGRYSRSSRPFGITLQIIRKIR